MKDIDFDELDRAVSSLLSKKDGDTNKTDQSIDTTTAVDTVAVTDSTGDSAAGSAIVEPDLERAVNNKTATADTPEQIEVQTSSLAEEQPLDATTVDSELSSSTLETKDIEGSAPEVVLQASEAQASTETEGESNTADENTAALPSRRRGKFMDVMHPSSDMNPDAETPVPQLAPVLRKQLQPLNNHAEEAEPAKLEEDDAADSTDVLSLDTPMRDGAMIDEASFDQTVTSLESEGETASRSLSGATPDSPDFPKETVLETEGKEENDNTENSTLAEDETKTDDDTGNEAAPITPFLANTEVDKRPLGAFGEGEKEDTENSDVELSKTSDVSDTPRELQSDIVEIEKMHSGDTVTISEAQSDPHSEAVKAVLAENDKEAHPLFDTTTYHQPLQNDEKHGKKSSSTVLIFLLVLLASVVVGGAAGYLFFTGGF